MAYDGTSCNTPQGHGRKETTLSIPGQGSRPIPPPGSWATLFLLLFILRHLSLGEKDVGGNAFLVPLEEGTNEQSAEEIPKPNIDLPAQLPLFWNLITQGNHQQRPSTLTL